MFPQIPFFHSLSQMRYYFNKTKLYYWPSINFKITEEINQYRHIRLKLHHLMFYFTYLQEQTAGVQLSVINLNVICRADNNLARDVTSLRLPTY